MYYFKVYKITLWIWKLQEIFAISSSIINDVNLKINHVMISQIWQEISTYPK